MRKKRYHSELHILLLLTFIVILFCSFGIVFLTMLKEAIK